MSKICVMLDLKILCFFLTKNYVRFKNLMLCHNHKNYVVFNKMRVKNE